MDSSHACARWPASAPRKPTEYLLRKNTDQLSPAMVYRLTVKGFDLNDVKDMLAISDLYSTKKLSLIHISEPTRHFKRSRMPSSA